MKYIRTIGELCQWWFIHFGASIQRGLTAQRSMVEQTKSKVDPIGFIDKTQE